MAKRLAISTPKSRNTAIHAKATSSRNKPRCCPNGYGYGVFRAWTGLNLSVILLPGFLGTAQSFG
jgi:hypothetical protein